MDAIVLAGGIPQPEDPLYTYSKGDAKALIELAGKPMIQWVLDALDGASSVSNIIVVGLSDKTTVRTIKPFYTVSNQGRMLSNIIAGIQKAVEINPETKYVMVVSADIPGLKSRMVDWLVSTAMQTQDDLYYGVCPRAVMEKRYPRSERSFTKFKDIELCGGDINIAHVRLAGERYQGIWETLIERRKSSLSQAAFIGLGTALLLRAGRLTLEEGVRRVCEKIGIKGRPIVWEYAEPAMDADKPHQLEILRADLLRQQRRAEAALHPRPKKKKPAKKVLKKAKRPASKKAKKVKSRPVVRRAARPRKRAVKKARRR
jgi:GTP:adenosylcobinamide-phosphate guanylyltransferase